MTQNLIALKIFTHILTTCLIFGSLYLPAYAANAHKTTSLDSQLKIKKAPEAYFLEGNTCLEQANPACANIALANIPSLSPYAKLLQGAIALNDQRTDDAQQISNMFKVIWLNKVNIAEPNDQVHVITLTSDLQSGDASLIDLKAQISAHRHDMVLLAMPAPVARIIKPYLNISTPTIAFSGLHDSTKPDASLNAVRFVDMPFLLPTNNNHFKSYQEINIQESNELSRWFALGADTPDLLIAYQDNDRETIINGLTGALTLNNTGSIQRQPTIARFTFDGIALEQ